MPITSGTSVYQTAFRRAASSRTRASASNVFNGPLSRRESDSAIRTSLHRFSESFKRDFSKDLLFLFLRHPDVFQIGLQPLISKDTFASGRNILIGKGAAGGQKSSGADFVPVRCGAGPGQEASHKNCAAGDANQDHPNPPPADLASLVSD